jgi:hypothetical protein
MKKLTATLLASSLLGLAAYAQGTVNFANVQGSLNVPVYASDGTTKLSGATYMAELMAGTAQNSINISVATTGFLTGAGAGYFNGGAKTITGIAGGATAWMQIRFWNTANGSTFAAASASGAANAFGSSTAFSITLGDPGAVPPTTPAALSGLAGQSLKLNGAVPEPSSLALAGLGAAALLVFRRRK